VGLIRFQLETMLSIELIGCYLDHNADVARVLHLQNHAEVGLQPANVASPIKVVRCRELVAETLNICGHQSCTAHSTRAPEASIRAWTISQFPSR
jgi:hypothetical protein